MLVVWCCCWEPLKPIIKKFVHVGRTRTQIMQCWGIPTVSQPTVTARLLNWKHSEALTVAITSCNLPGPPFLTLHLELEYGNLFWVKLLFLSGDSGRWCTTRAQYWWFATLYLHIRNVWKHFRSDTTSRTRRPAVGACTEGSSEWAFCWIRGSRQLSG